MFWKAFNSIIAPLCILIPIIVGAVRYRALPSSARIIWYTLVIAAVINTAATILGRVYHVNNLPLIHIFTLMEGLLLIAFYKYTLESKQKNYWYLFLQVVFLLICILNAAFFQSIYIYSSYTRYAESIILMLFALNYFAKVAATEPEILKTPAFFLNSGIFLYFSGSFILFIFSNLIIYKASLTNFLIIWNIHALLLIFMYLFFSFGFLICKK